MRIFFSAGEPSGDQHGAHLMAELRRRHPPARFSGFGGVEMEQAGLESLFRLTDLAVMGVWAVLPLLWTFVRLVRQARSFIERERPDAVVLIDFPGFNWWIARQAKRAGIPVFYYMPPQLWAWAPWRIRKVRKYVDVVLAALPFEAEWYRKRGIDVVYVGHPFFDEAAEHILDDHFCADLAAGLQERSRESAEEHTQPPRLVGVLPGSRNQEITRNFPVMLDVISQLHAQRANTGFAVACYRESHRRWCAEYLANHPIAAPLTLHVGRTPEIIATADCCLMVSGSVSLELLARGTPAVVLYRGSWLMWVLAKTLITCPYITLPNMIAGWPIMPEFPFTERVATHVRSMSSILAGWLATDESLQNQRRIMDELRSRVVRTGGVARAAAVIAERLEAASRPSRVQQLDIRRRAA